MIGFKLYDLIKKYGDDKNVMDFLNRTGLPVQDSTFGLYLDITPADPESIVFVGLSDNGGYKVLETRPSLPHQLYVKDLIELAKANPTAELVIFTVRINEIIKVVAP